MNTEQQKKPSILPFGRYAGQPLSEVPTSYLDWLLRDIKSLSSGLRSDVAGELERRGAATPRQAPRPVPVCPRCPPETGFTAHWQQDRRGRKFIRGECRGCRRWLAALPQIEPFVGMANAAASPTAVLDVLIALECLGIEIRSDGQAVQLGRCRENAPPDLLALVRQCNNQLAQMLGKI
jgi:hypothetical protein